MSIFKNKKEFTRFIKFGTVGLIGSVIDFGIFNLLTIVLHVTSIASSTVSFALAVINNFILNRFWTYPESRQSSIYKPLVQFVIVSCLGLAIRIPLFAWLEKVLIPLAAKTFPHFLTPTIIGHNVALALVIGVVMMWNYLVNRFWTFKNVPA